jgi:hypothetical protein
VEVRHELGVWNRRSGDLPFYRMGHRGVHKARKPD